MKKEKSCGCIIIENNKVLLINQKEGDFWGFPKGHIEENETEIETAKRETKEETNIDVEIDASKRYELTYIIRQNIEKTCVLFIAYPKTHNIIVQEKEVIRAEWFDFDTAIEMIKYEDLKKILIKAIKEL